MGLLTIESKVNDYLYFSVWEIIDLLHQVELKKPLLGCPLFSWNEVSKYLGYYKFDTHFQLFKSDEYGRITKYEYSHPEKNPILELIEVLNLVFFTGDTAIELIEQNYSKYFWLQDELYAFKPFLELEEFKLPSPFFFGGEPSEKEILKFGNNNISSIEALKFEIKDLKQKNQGLLEQLQHLKQELINSNNKVTHPSLDPTNTNHAPELILALEIWEEKYIKDQYPHKEHTPAIESICENRKIKNGRLISRIAAITNPKKK